MVPGVDVLGMRSLAQVVAELRDEPVPDAPPVAEMSGRRLLSWRGEQRMDDIDLADLIGMHDTRYAVEVAAAGGHHLLLSGPKGSGKTSIAERIPGILPDLTREESLELTAVHSLAGALDPLIASGGVIELDLAALRFMDSTGVKAICDATQRLGPRGRIRVVNPQPGVQRVIAISGLDGMFDVLAARRPPT